MEEIINHLNETVKCKVGASNIAGVGVIALRDIKKGEKLSLYTLGNINEVKPFYYFTRDDFNKLAPHVQKIILDRSLFDAHNTIVAFIHPDYEALLTTFMNHADDPNSDSEVALKDIKDGEEITFDYHQSRLNKFEVSNEFDELTLKHMPFLCHKQ